MQEKEFLFKNYLVSLDYILNDLSIYLCYAMEGYSNPGYKVENIVKCYVVD